MKYIIIIGILCIFLMFGCTTQKVEDKNIPIIDKNIPIVYDNNIIATCDDNTKHLVITDTPEGQIWECV